MAEKAKTLTLSLIPALLLAAALIAAPSFAAGPNPGDSLYDQPIVPPLVSQAAAQAYDWQNWRVIGSPREHRVREGESLLEIARDYGLGYREITRANPKLSPLLPDEGARVVIPSARILPEYPLRHGIVVNLAEKRLYYFFRQNGENLVITFPVGIGDQSVETPLGDFMVTTKLINPNWTVPKSIREKRPDMPGLVPPGPDNPMGSYALQLSGSRYFIHGTNQPWSIGQKATNGCIRLYPEDIFALFWLVPTETPVRIINQPVKVGRQEERIYIEVHQVEGLEDSDYLRSARGLLRRQKLAGKADPDRLARAIQRKEGMAVRIDRR